MSLTDLHTAADSVLRTGYDSESVSECAAFVSRLTDPTAIDEGWLKSVGARSYCEPDKWCSSYLSFWSDDHPIGKLAVHWARPTNESGIYWSLNGYTMPRSAWPTTRGQLRLLCLALGIELGE